MLSQILQLSPCSLQEALLRGSLVPDQGALAGELAVAVLALALLLVAVVVLSVVLS